MPASSCCPIPFDAVPCKIQVNFDYGCSSSPSSSSSPSGSSGSSDSSVSSGLSSPGDSSMPSGSSGSSGPSGSSGSGQSSCSSSCSGCCGKLCGTCSFPKVLFVTVEGTGCEHLDRSFELHWAKQDPPYAWWSCSYYDSDLTDPTCPGDPSLFPPCEDLGFSGGFNVSINCGPPQTIGIVVDRGDGPTVTLDIGQQEFDLISCNPVFARLEDVPFTISNTDGLDCVCGPDRSGTLTITITE